MAAGVPAPTPSIMNIVQLQDAGVSMASEVEKYASNANLEYLIENEESSSEITEMPVEEAENKLKLKEAKRKKIDLDVLLNDLSELILCNVPDSAQRLSIIAKLDLSNNNMKSLPESITSLVKLKSLDLHSNQLTALPHSIGRLVKLKFLNASGNLLVAFPESIQNCRALEELSADFNQLKWLPESLGFELVNLQKLSVHSNKLSYLPASICHIMSLRVLDVHMNKLRSVPAEIDNLVNLEILDVSRNFHYLGSLPDSIGGLVSLMELDASYNQITALPCSIAGLEELQRLKVEGNPLILPPPKIVELGLDAIKSFLEEKLVSKSRRIRGMTCMGYMLPRCVIPPRGSMTWNKTLQEDGSEENGVFPTRGVISRCRSLSLRSCLSTRSRA
eukprot:Gb_29820 [translate_table: standard]